MNQFIAVIQHRYSFYWCIFSAILFEHIQNSLWSIACVMLAINPPIIHLSKEWIHHNIKNNKICTKQLNILLSPLAIQCKFMQFHCNSCKLMLPVIWLSFFVSIYVILCKDFPPKHFDNLNSKLQSQMTAKEVPALSHDTLTRIQLWLEKHHNPKRGDVLFDEGSLTKPESKIVATILLPRLQQLHDDVIWVRLSKVIDSVLGKKIDHKRLRNKLADQV